MIKGIYIIINKKNNARNKNVEPIITTSVFPEVVIIYTLSRYTII